LKLGLSEGELGALLLGMPMGSLIALPLAGWLVDKFGSRTTVIIASLLYASVLPLVGIAPSFWILAVILIIYGMCGNLLNISMNTQAIGVEDIYGRTIIASFHGLWSLAGFTGGMIGALMIGIKFIPAVHFSIITGISFSMVLLIYRYTLTTDVRKSSGGMIFRKPDRWLMRIGLIAFCGMMCEGCMFDWSGVYFQKVVKAEKGLITAGYVAFMSTMALGRFISDYFTDRLGINRMWQMSSVFICSGLLLTITFPYLIPSIIGFLLVGFGVSSVIPLSYSAAGKSNTLSPAVALAMVSSIGYFGFLFGPPLIGFIAETFSLRISFAYIACMAALIGILATRSSAPKVYPQLK
jgi:MFS family permease